MSDAWTLKMKPAKPPIHWLGLAVLFMMMVGIILVAGAVHDRSDAATKGCTVTLYPDGSWSPQDTTVNRQSVVDQCTNVGVDFATR